MRPVGAARIVAVRVRITVAIGADIPPVIAVAVAVAKTGAPGPTRAALDLTIFHIWIEQPSGLIPACRGAQAEPVLVASETLAVVILIEWVGLVVILDVHHSCQAKLLEIGGAGGLP